MAFEIDITEPALADAEEYVRFIRDIKNEPEAAEELGRPSLKAALLAGMPIFPFLGLLQTLIHQLSGLRQEFPNFLPRMSLQRIQ